MSERPLDLLIGFAIRFAGTAAFPRLAHLLRWPTRLGWRGTAAYVMSTVVMAAWVRGWVVPHFERIAARYRELQEDLGEKPTREKVLEHMARLDAEGRL